ncbi:MAG TPA: outer membrane beta-barrel protein [Chryseosolibacter sp.]|nr:outer membrane beta-barrel protein [Chryseosolibacter sp.]
MPPQFLTTPLLALCLWILGCASYGQTNLRQGYIITNLRDTVAGLINYKEGPGAYEAAQFKASTSESVVTYYPADIAGYGFVDDIFYESKTIIANDSTQKRTFLEVIVKGDLQLYKSHKTYWVQKGDTEVRALKDEYKPVIVNQINRLQRTNQHIALLNTLMSDCSALRTRVQNVTLSERSLADLVARYNRCKGQVPVVYKSSKSWVKAAVVLMAGVNNSKFTFESSYSPCDHIVGTYEPDRSFTGGVFADFFTPRLSERFGLRLGIQYLDTRYYSYYYRETQYQTYRDYSTLQLKQLKVPLGIRYNPPWRILKPYSGFGLSYTSHLSSDWKWREEIETSTELTINDRKPPKLKNNQVGLWGNVGLMARINNTFQGYVEVRYERTNGPALPWTDISSSITNFQLAIGVSVQ